MEVQLIVAVAKKNNGIGKNNQLLWHLPADMKFFKETTTGFPIITGRKNYESIPEKFRPLPNRENIVITRNPNYPSDGCFVVSSLESAIEKAKSFNKSKCFIIGGGQIYKEAIEKAMVNEMFVSWVDGDFEADTFFPLINPENWEKTIKFSSKVDDKNKYPFTIVNYTAKFAK